MGLFDRFGKKEETPGAYFIKEFFFNMYNDPPEELLRQLDQWGIAATAP